MHPKKNFLSRDEASFRKTKLCSTPKEQTQWKWGTARRYQLKAQSKPSYRDRQENTVLLYCCFFIINLAKPLCLFLPSIIIVVFRPTLAIPWTVAHPAPLSMGDFTGKNTGVAISFSKGSSWPRDWTQVSCLAGRLLCFFLLFFFTTEPHGKPNHQNFPSTRHIKLTIWKCHLTYKNTSKQFNLMHQHQGRQSLKIFEAFAPN